MGSNPLVSGVISLYGGWSILWRGLGQCFDFDRKDISRGQSLKFNITHSGSVWGESEIKIKVVVKSKTF